MEESGALNSNILYQRFPDGSLGSLQPANAPQRQKTHCCFIASLIKLHFVRGSVFMSRCLSLCFVNFNQLTAILRRSFFIGDFQKVSILG